MRPSLPLVALLALSACGSSSETTATGATSPSTNDAGSSTPAEPSKGASICSLDAALSSSGTDRAQIAVDGAGTHLYVTSSDDKIRRFTIGNGCALTLDATFGAGGAIVNDAPGSFFWMATDRSLALHRRASNRVDMAIGRVWPLPVVNCAPALGETFAVTDDGTKGYSVGGEQGKKTVVLLDMGTGTACTATATTTALGVTDVNATGLAPDGTVLFASWRSSPSSNPVVIYDPVTKLVTGEFGGQELFQVTTVHACGSDVCFYDANKHELSRYGSNHARKATYELDGIVPSGAREQSAAITDGGVAYVLYANTSSLGIARVVIP